MAEANGSDGAVAGNKAIVLALFKHLSLDPNNVPVEKIKEGDIASLFSDALQLSEKDVPLQHQDEVMKWVAFASSFPGNADACHAALSGLNKDLSQKAVLLGHGLRSSVADIAVFSAVHPFVSNLNERDLQKIPHVMRWIDYIQNSEDFDQIFEKIQIIKPAFEPYQTKRPAKVDADSSSKKVDLGQKSVDKSDVKIDSKKVVDKSDVKVDSKKVVAEKASGEDKSSAKTAKNEEGTKEKKKVPEESAAKDLECSISVLNIQVGLIIKAWKHPSADSLLVEEIDLGDGNLRQVVSGLAKYYSPEQLVNRRVVLITNVKPGKLRDVMSAGLVLCASNHDHTVVEPLAPPDGAKIGERISFAAYDGKPEDVLNPKKKQLDKITPHLCTDDKGEATFKGVSFMTSAGPCTASIPNASIK